MSRDWQISTLGAALFHLALLFGFQITLSLPPRLPSRKTLEVTLVAAPAPVVIAPVIRPELPIIPPPQPPPLVVKPLVPIPVEKVIAPIPAPAKAVVAPTSPPPKPTPVGAGSSIKPGSPPLRRPPSQTSAPRRII